MSVRLLHLSDGHVSLEFGSGDIQRVADAIRKRFGIPEQDRYPLITVYRFGGCTFVFQNEWDDPCLISNCKTGDRILSDLRDALQDAR